VKNTRAISDENHAIACDICGSLLNCDELTLMIPISNPSTKTMLEWANSMTWKGLHSIVERSHQLYEKRISLSKEAMRAVGTRLQRHPELPTWDVLIRPACVAWDSSEIT